MAFTILVLAALVALQADVARSRTPSNFHDLGKLMFAFVMLWAYFNVSQLIIIWSAQPARRDSVLPRAAARPVGAGQRRAAVGQFALPFLLLLSRDLEAQAATRRADRALRARHARRRHHLDDRPGLPPRGLDDLAGWTSPPCSAWAASGCSSSSATSPAARSCRRTIRTSRKRWLMADTKHAHARGRVARPDRRRRRQLHAASSGSSSILAVTTLVCQVLMWGCSSRSRSDGRARRRRRARRSRRRPARCRRPPTGTSSLHRTLLGEPANLERSAQQEDDVLTTYGWVDKNARRRADSDRAREGAAARARACRCEGRRRRRPRRRRRSASEVDEVAKSESVNAMNVSRIDVACWSRRPPRRRRVVVCVDRVGAADAAAVGAAAGTAATSRFRC